MKLLTSRNILLMYIWPIVVLAQSGSAPSGDGCIVCSSEDICPTGETTTFDGWGYGFFALGKFYSCLLPANVDFSGCKVKEQNPGGAVDYCWYAGSALQKNEDGITGSINWPVGANNRWGPDIIRIWTQDMVDYYRTHPAGQSRAPCSAVWPQKMVVVCPDKAIQYKVNTLVSVINMADVTITRNSATGVYSYP